MRKLLLISLGGIGLIAGIILTFLWLVSPQQTQPHSATLSTRSIAEISEITLNGAPQRILVRGEDTGNPILLHIHGGPGGADQAVMRYFNFDLEDQFTVVYWDQRGAGASYSSELDPETLSLQQIVNDGLALTEYLKGEFKQDKIFLQGHSWGTLVGMHMVAQAPQHFHAYFGIGQVAKSKRAEVLSFEHALQRARDAGDQETVDGLEIIGAPPYKTEEQWKGAVMTQRALMQPYEMPDGSRLMTEFEMYRVYTLYRGYSIKDKLASLEGAAVSLDRMWMDAINANLFEQIPRVDVPVYIFQGKHDYHTVTEVAKDYFEVLEAPDKAYFEFENSAHFPHLREFDAYRDIVLELTTRILEKP